MTDFADFLTAIEKRGGYVGDCKAYIDRQFAGMTWAQVLPVIRADPEFDPDFARWCLIHALDLIPNAARSAAVQILASAAARDDVYAARAARVYVRTALPDAEARILRDAFRGKFEGAEAMLARVAKGEALQFGRSDLKDLETRLG